MQSADVQNSETGVIDVIVPVEDALTASLPFLTKSPPRKNAEYLAPSSWTWSKQRGMDWRVPRSHVPLMLGNFNSVVLFLRLLCIACLIDCWLGLLTLEKRLDDRIERLNNSQE